MAFFITEGPNGSGKTTLIKNLAKMGYTTLSSPCGTPLAQMLRPACRGTEPWQDISATIQFLLFSAARYDEYLRCVKDKKEPVVADRWWTSTYVYQCQLQKIPIQFLEYTIHPQEKIDCIILLDAKDDILIKRVKTEREKNPSHGICSWTKEEETMLKLIEIYRKDLPPYLSSKQIKHVVIDTSDKDIVDVLNEAEHIIRKLS